MADQQVSVNFVAKSDQFLNPMNQMSKALGNFSSVGKMAKDVLITFAVIAAGAALAMLAPKSAVQKLQVAVEFAFAKMATAAAWGGKIITREVQKIAVTFGEAAMTAGINTAKVAATTMTRAMMGGVLGVGFIDKAAIGLGLAIGGGLYKATKAAADFEVGMRDVNSLLGYSEPQYNKLSVALLHISENFPVSAKDVAAGAYKIASAGFTNLTDVITITKQAALGAAAGLSDEATSASVLVTVLNAYGLAASDAAMVTNVLMAGVKMGQFNYQELSGQLTSFIALARNSGVSLKETISSYAIMANATGSAAESATYLAATFKAVIKPSNDLSKVVRLMGFETVGAAVSQIGFIGTVKAVSAAVNGNATALSHLFPNVRALNGVLAITGTSNEKLASVIDGVNHSTDGAGAATIAYNEQLKSVNTKLGVFKNATIGVGIEIGRHFLPILGFITVFLGGFLGMLKDTPDWVKTVIGTVAGLSAALLVLGGVIKGAQAMWAIMKLAMKTLDITGFNGGLKSAATSMGILDKASGAASANLVRFGQAMTIAGTAIAVFQILAQINDAWSHTNTKVKELSSSLMDFATGAKTSSNIINQSSFISATGIKGLAQKFGGGAELQAVGGKWKTQAQAIDTALAALVTGGNVKAAGDALLKFSQDADMQARFGFKGLDAQTKTYQKLLSIFPQYSGALTNLGLDTKLTAGATKEQQDALNAIQNTYGNAAGAAISLGDAEIFLQDATDAMNYSQKELQTTLASAWHATPTDALASITAAHQAAATAANANTTAQAKATPDVILTGQYAIQKAIMAVTTARAALLVAQQKNFSIDVRAAQWAITLSYETTTRSVYALADATKILTELQKPPARTIDEAQIALTGTLNGQADAVAAVVVAQDKLKLAQDHALPVEIAQATRDLVTAQDAVRTSGYAVIDAQTKYNDLTSKTPQNQRNIAEATMNVADATHTVAANTDATTTAVQALSDLRVQIADQPNVIAAAELALKEAILGVGTATDSLNKTLAGPATAAAAATFDSGLDMMKTGLDELSKKMETQITDQENYWKNIQTIAERYGPGVANQMIKMGKDGAGAVDKMATDSGVSGQRFANDLMTNAALGTKTFMAIVQSNFSNLPGQIRTYTQEGAAALADELGIGVDKASKILDSYGLKLQNTVSGKWTEVAPGNWHYILPNGATMGPLSHAQGGLYEDHSPQITHRLRVFGEPETGGEAYIPLSPNKRKGSLDLLARVAEIFGVHHFADGGITAPLTLSDFMAAGNKMVNIIPTIKTSKALYDVAAKRITDQQATATASASAVSSGIDVGAPQSPGSGGLGDNQRLMQQMAAARGWGGMWPALYAVEMREAGFNQFAQNPTSSAYGIAQALPPTKYPFAGQKAGGSDPGTQIAWMLGYIASRYGTPNAALAHEQSAGWYGQGGVSFDRGGWLPPKSTTMAVNNTRHWEPVGQADGPTRVTYMVPVTVDARIASNVDLDKASEIIAEHVTRGVTVALAGVERKVLAKNGR